MSKKVTIQFSADSQSIQAGTKTTHVEAGVSESSATKLYKQCEKFMAKIKDTKVGKDEPMTVTMMVSITGMNDLVAKATMPLKKSKNLQRQLCDALKKRIK